MNCDCPLEALFRRKDYEEKRGGGRSQSKEAAPKEAPGVGENSEHMKMPWELEQSEQSGQKFRREGTGRDENRRAFFSFANLLTRTQLDVYSHTSKTSCVQLKPMGTVPLEHSFRHETYLSPETRLRSLAQVIKSSTTVTLEGLQCSLKFLL